MSGPVQNDAWTQLVVQCLALALGHGDRASEVTDWPTLYAIAFRERCATLAWMRSGAAIRKHAPPELASEWRRHAVNVSARGERALTVLASLQRRFREKGIETVSLKGPVLAADLYGLPLARPIDDIDLFVARDDRFAVREMLFSEGWARLELSRNNDMEVFQRDERGFVQRLDVLSRFPKQLPTGGYEPPESAMRMLDGHEVRAHAGPSVAPYLAGHLAKDEFPPLLWFLDFSTWWTRLDEGERARARESARRLLLHKHLAWAIKRSDAIGRALQGDPEALRLLGIVGGKRVQARRWRRDLALAGNLRTALWALARAVLPPEERNPRGVFTMITRRLKRLRHPRNTYADDRDWNPPSRDARS